MAVPGVRLGGSGLTVFHWNGGSSPVLYLQTIQDTAPTPVAQAVPVQSITDATPSEIVTALAVGPGTLRATFYEKFDVSVWEQFVEFAGSHSLLEVLTKQIALGAITCSKIIKIPNGDIVVDAKGALVSSTGVTYRTKTYQNCKIVDVDDGEQINIGTMVMPKGITIMYTHYTIT